jgi:hypothetical protein
METVTRLLDEATHRHVVEEMRSRSFEDSVAAVRHLAYSVRSGKRFSPGDVMAIFSDANLDMDGISAVLEEMSNKRFLQSYPKDGTVAYFMERGPRIEYGESIGRKSRVSSWYFTGSAPGDPCYGDASS